MNVDVYFLNTFSYYESLLLAFQKEKKINVPGAGKLPRGE